MYRQCIYLYGDSIAKYHTQKAKAAQLFIRDVLTFLISDYLSVPVPLQSLSY